MYFVDDIHSVPSSSLVKSMRRWNVIDLVPLSLNSCFFPRTSVNSLGFFIAMAKSSTYTAMYSYWLFFFLIQMSGSALHGKNPSSLMQSGNLSCHLAPLLHRSYSALLMTRICPSLSPNSVPAIMYTFRMCKLLGMHYLCPSPKVEVH
jgi:hypothetical protein